MFREILLQHAPSLTKEQLDALDVYYTLLMDHASQYNLTSIHEEAEVAVKHFYDSLVFGSALGLEGKKGATILDLGTGAGFPGLVLAIVHPECRFTLVDAVNKKVNFIRAVASALGLMNVEALHARSEALGQDPSYRERFDVGVARGVAYLPTLSEYLLPLIRVGGRMVLSKELPCEEELERSRNALEVLGARYRESAPYELPLYGNRRALLVFDKVAPTPGKYPRREGVPSKKPL